MTRDTLRLAFCSILVVTAATGCASTQNRGAPPEPTASAPPPEPTPSRDDDAPSPRPPDDEAPPTARQPAPLDEAPAVVEPVVEDTMIEVDAVRFAYDSARLDAEARLALEELAEHLRAHPRLQVTLEGHCDERGTAAYNLALGHLRADTMKAFLVDHGVEEDRIRTVSYGEERPAVFDDGPEAWAANRRGEMLLTGEGEATARAQ